MATSTSTKTTGAATGSVGNGRTAMGANIKDGEFTKTIYTMVSVFFVVISGAVLVRV